MKIDRLPSTRDVGSVKMVIPYRDGVRGRFTFRWFVASRNGRLVVRAPKRGVAIKDFKKKRSSDFGPARVLASHYRIKISSSKSRAVRSRAVRSRAVRSRAVRSRGSRAVRRR